MSEIQGDTCDVQALEAQVTKALARTFSVWRMRKIFLLRHPSYLQNRTQYFPVLSVRHDPPRPVHREPLVRPRGIPRRGILRCGIRGAGP
jgi:hypothetical protein